MRLKNWLIFLGVAALSLAALPQAQGLGSWKNVKSNPDYLVGPALEEEGDPKAKTPFPQMWNEVVVMENAGPDNYHPGYRNFKGEEEANTSVRVSKGGRFALRIGKEKVGFLLVGTKGQSIPQTPLKIERLSNAEFKKKYPNVPLY